MTLNALLDSFLPESEKFGNEGLMSVSDVAARQPLFCFLSAHVSVFVCIVPLRDLEGKRFGQF